MLAKLNPFLLAALALALSTCASPQSGGGPVANNGGPFMTGAELLASRNFDFLRGKRVGLITNQTGILRNGTPTRVAMRQAGVNLVALYAPEHGLYGTDGAGAHVTSRRDSVTGLMCWSLYDTNREPSAAMLAPIDVMVFDIQDIGSRSYTYISTMIRSMEACGKNGKDFVVLDRPNPLGGNRIQGPGLERSWTSFVGQVPVPYLHGMTAGELAKMAMGEGWLSARPRNLQVIPMSGWNRNLVWQDLGLPWRQTSPNIPTGMSPFYYAATGILGGASNCDIGIGAGRHFMRAGAAGVNGNQLAAIMRPNFPGVGFTPYTYKNFGGVELNINPHSNVDLIALDVALTSELNRLSGGRVARMSGDQLDLFNKVYGSASFYQALQRGADWRGIAGSWQGANQAFAGRRQRYLMY